MKRHFSEKLLSIVLSVILLLGMLPTMAFATEAGEPAKDSNGVYQIGTAAELLWFQQNGNSADAVLTADIDLSSVCSSTMGTSWVAIPSYSGTFDGQGHIISNLYMQIDTKTANQGLFAEIASGGTIKNLGIKTATVVLTQRFNNTKAAALAGTNSGDIISCFVVDSSITVNAQGLAKVAAICGNNTGSIQNSYSLCNTITDSNNKYQIGGISGYSSGLIKNCYTADTQLVTTSTNEAIRPIAGANNDSEQINCYYVSSTKEDNKATHKDVEWFKSDEAITALGSAFVKDTENINYGYPVLTFAGETVDKGALSTALDAANSISGYYIENDRYNGKAADTLTASNGSFWSEMQAVVSEAKTVYDNENATQDAIDAAAALLDQSDSNSVLSKAIAKLIPAEQVNPTALYEALQSYDTEYYRTRDNWSTKSFSGFETALNSARRLLDSLYENGGPTANNIAENQGDVDAAATALTEIGPKLDERVNLYQQPDFENALAGIRLYAERFDPEKLTQSDFTPESWNALVSARSEALALLESNGQWYAGLGLKEVSAQTAAFKELRAACYGLVEAKGSISVRVSVVDNYAIRRSRQVNTATKTLTLEPGASIGDAWDQVITGNFDIVWDDAVCVYLNGMLCYNVSGSGLNGGNGYSDPGQYRNFKLRDGDELVIARIAPRIGKNTSENSETEAANAVLELLRHQRITTSLTDGRAKAGVPFTVSVSAAKTMPTLYDGVYTPVSGASIYIGTANAVQSAAETSLVNKDTLLVTDSKGEASVMLYDEGWVLLNAFDRSSETGTYTNGAAVLIYVEAADELSAVKATLQAELDAAVRNELYPESHFSADDWSAVQSAYAEGTEAIAAAGSSGAAREAQLAALKLITDKQTASDEYNASNLNYFKTQLERLTDGIETLDASEQNYVDSLIRAYDNMTAYQQEQLTPQDISNYEAILAKNKAGLPEAVPYALKVEYDLSAIPEADRAGLQSMFGYLQANAPKEGVRDTLGGSTLAQLYTFNTTESGGGFALKGTVFTPVTEAIGGTTVSFCTSPRYATYLMIRGDRTKTINQQPYGDEAFVYDLEGDGWKITDALAKGDADTGADGNVYTVNGHSYVMQGIAVEGVDASALTTLGEGFYDFSDYRGKNPSNQFFITLPDTFYRFSMPRNDVTFTVKWVPVAGSSEEIQAAKEAAISGIEAKFAAYVEADYSETNWQSLLAAKDNAIAGVNGAESVSAVTAARQAGIAAMAIIKTKAQESDTGTSTGGASEVSLPDYGRVVGQVHIIVENQTFKSVASDGSTPAWYGTLIDGWYDLCENDTMMTAILKALQLKGCNWSTGSQGVADTWDDYSISYIASVKVPAGTTGGGDFVLAKPGESLGEFSGEVGSGWMGTLNDWFVNYGFNQFGVADGKLENGDEIHVMFTQNMGDDLGGTWSSSDTRLNSLAVSGGQLSPAFDSDVTEYTLTISGERANVTVVPAANNKNYQVRTFLNDYNSNAAEYKRSETVSVKAGDVIYVGCGEHSWPSMNNQGDEARSYTGTKYTIKVVNASSSDAVEKMINEIGSVSYANYKSKTEKVSLARTAYDALTAEAQSKVKNADKLTEAEAAIAKFEQIDNVKTLLAAIPAADKLSSSAASAVRTASNAYNALSAEQQAYITVGDAKKFNDAVAWLQAYDASFNIAPIIASKEAPVEGTEIAPAATVDSTGAAKAEVSAEAMDSIIENAKTAASEGASAEAPTVVIKPEIEGEASKVAVELPTASVETMAKDTDAALAVETELGSVNISNEALTSIAAQAEGERISIQITEKAAADVQADAVATEQLTADELEKAVIVDVTVTSNGKQITSFGGAELTLELPTKQEHQEGKTYLVIAVSDDGTVSKLFGTVKNGKLVVKTTHLTTFIATTEEANPFTDIDGHWAAEAIQYAFAKGLMSGVADTLFDPNGTVTRAMVVTVLHRMENTPAAKSENPFSDVAAGTWYTDAVLWAAENQIVEGYDGRFSPTDAVTREQFAAMLYRYAKYKQYDISKLNDLAAYTDAVSISDWAKTAMQWANGAKLITGRTTATLVPTGTATRAEMASIMMRFCEGAAK